MNKSLVGNVVLKLQSFLNYQNLKTKISEYFQDVIPKLKDLPGTNFNLGKYHLKKGMINDAILRFRFARFLNPNLLATDYFLGRCFYEKYNYDKARQYLLKYLISGNTNYIEETKFCLAVIDKKFADIKSIPLSIIQNNFNQLSSIYSSLMIDNRDSTPQQALFDMVSNHMLELQHPFANNILDLGCGTGYTGILAKDNKLANNIAGVDIAEDMITICDSLLTLDNKKIYDFLYNESAEKFITDYILTDKEKFDIIFAYEIISFNTDISKILLACSNILKPNGIIAITYKLNEEGDIEFNPAFEEFRYSEAYVIQKSQEAGFKVNSNDIIFQTGDMGKIAILTKLQN